MVNFVIDLLSPALIILLGAIIATIGFAMGGDPVKLGVVASLARPGGNITAALFVDTEPFFTDRRANIVALAARHALTAQALGLEVPPSILLLADEVIK